MILVRKTHLLDYCGSQISWKLSFLTRLNDALTRIFIIIPHVRFLRFFFFSRHLPLVDCIGYPYFLFWGKYTWSKDNRNAFKMPTTFPPVIGMINIYTYSDHLAKPFFWYIKILHYEFTNVLISSVWQIFETFLMIDNIASISTRERYDKFIV